MSDSTVAICNRALDFLGADPIMALTDNSKPARLMNRNFALVRDAVLRAYPWHCATARASLPALSAAPQWGYTKQYQVPTDFLRMLRIDIEGEFDYRVEGRAILTDLSAPLNILYTARITDPALFDPLLADAIAARLAADLCYTITGSSQGQSNVQGIYRTILAEARAADAQEGTPYNIEARDWLDARS